MEDILQSLNLLNLLAQAVGRMGMRTAGCRAVTTWLASPTHGHGDGQIGAVECRIELLKHRDVEAKLSSHGGTRVALREGGRRGRGRRRYSRYSSERSIAGVRSERI